MNLFSNPYIVPIDDVLGKMEILYVQCNGGLKKKYGNFGLVDLYSKFTLTNTFPVVHSQALKMVSLFGIIY
jgi:hypothetical protein